LGDNPDIAVLIEGHTDDDAFTASGPYCWWDLSTKRATSIVAILSENKINKENLTAAGESFLCNATADGKSKP
jgi:chemotaxis protein MotB